jgi:hypothetical protein
MRAVGTNAFAYCLSTLSRIGLASMHDKGAYIDKFLQTLVAQDIE